MKERTIQYSLRIPRDVYENAIDVARVFDLSLNQLFLEAIRELVESQLQQGSTRSAVAKTREARRARPRRARKAPDPPEPA
ncbi:MAG TPA: hypothetical protein VMR50_12265 [Myxococcota bacterium]|nr:hypothetical protein [Myxococcota bacterium]